MTEDLLEEMDGDMEDDFLDRAETKSKKPLDKKSFVKRLLGSKKRLILILTIATGITFWGCDDSILSDIGEG